MKRTSKGNIYSNNRIVRVRNGFAKEYSGNIEWIDFGNGLGKWIGNDYKPSFNEYDQDMIKRHIARKNRELKKEIMFYV